METGWALVGCAVVAAREAKGWLQADLIRESQVSDATVRKIERGHDQRYRTDIKRAVEGALDWPVGHIDRLLRGEDVSSPVVSVSPELDARFAALEASLRAELAELRADLRAAVDAQLRVAEAATGAMMLQGQQIEKESLS